MTNTNSNSLLFLISFQYATKNAIGNAKEIPNFNKRDFQNPIVNNGKIFITTPLLSSSATSIVTDGSYIVWYSYNTHKQPHRIGISEKKNSFLHRYLVNIKTGYATAYTKKKLGLIQTPKTTYNVIKPFLAYRNPQTA